MLGKIEQGDGVEAIRKLRGALRRRLEIVGLLEAARRVHRWIWLTTDPEVRSARRRYRGQFAEFRRQHGVVLGHRWRSGEGSTRTALVVSCRHPALEVELALIKTLQCAGFRPIVLLEDGRRFLRPYFELAEVKEIRSSSEFLAGREKFERSAAAAVGRCVSIEDVVGLAHDGVRTGRIAASTALRQLRVGSLDLQIPRDRRVLIERLAASLAVVAQAEKVLEIVRPDLAFFVDTEYTPKGEWFDACLARGVDVIAYEVAHKRNALMFKRYTWENRDQHLASLSLQSWTLLRELEWTEARRSRLDRELATCYASGDWYGSFWTQTNTRSVGPVELRRSLGLHPSKKTAVIFPHILWDGPFFWARMLFSSYEKWLIETVRAACANDRVNWIIKIHPAHVGKRAKEGYKGEPAEIRVLREHIGTLPSHVVLIPPETNVSTRSLFDVMDYCLTVRGTVGLEAASLGIPVLTAAASRYSHRGFTVDSESAEEYLARVAQIEDTVALSAEQRDLAGRYAYGLFVLRPLVMKSVTWEYGQVGQPTCARIGLTAPDEWSRAEDVGALAEWFRAARDEDFVNGTE